MEWAIGWLVYELYGLTEKEIRIVDGVCGSGIGCVGRRIRRTTPSP